MEKKPERSVCRLSISIYWNDICRRRIWQLISLQGHRGSTKENKKKSIYVNYLKE